MYISSRLKDDDKIAIEGYGEDLMAGTDDFAKIVRALAGNFEKAAIQTAKVCKKYLTWLDDKIGNHNGKFDMPDFTRLSQNIGDYIWNEQTLCERSYESAMTKWSERLKPFKKELVDFLRGTDVYKYLRSDELDKALNNYELGPGFAGDKEIYKYFGDPLEMLGAADYANFLKIMDKVEPLCNEAIDIANRADECNKHIKSMIEFNEAFNASRRGDTHRSDSPVEPLLEKYFAAQNYLILTEIPGEEASE